MRKPAPLPVDPGVPEARVVQAVQVAQRVTVELAALPAMAAMAAMAAVPMAAMAAMADLHYLVCLPQAVVRAVTVAWRARVALAARVERPVPVAWVA